MATQFEYTCEARSVDAFLAQLVRYVSSGHWFYVTCRIPDHKDPAQIDEKMVGLYDIARPRWRRKRRNLRQGAGIHYLRHEQFFIVILTKGNHEQFYRDHGDRVLDIRRTALKFRSYSIRHTYSQIDRRWRTFVRLDRETYRVLKGHMLAICTWDCNRSVERMEREFERLPYQRYGPVKGQLCSIVRAVNRRRRGAGSRAISFACVDKPMRVTAVFSDELDEQWASHKSEHE